MEDSEMGDESASDGDSKPSLRHLLIRPHTLLTYEQVLQWWEEENVPKLLAEGWTREQIDKGCKPRSDGGLGWTRLAFPRPMRDRGGVVLKKRDAWFP